MPDRIQDQEQRRRALDHSQSFIVQAPAGSGKTELLIQRFLTLLSLSDQPESIVAITFTRKAAAQMRQRVIGALQNASEPMPETAHEHFTWKLARAALARNDTFNWRLIENPGRLRIQTIDSLCATFVRQMPWVSRLGTPPHPEDDAAHLYRQAATGTLQMLDSPRTPDVVAEALSKLLSHLDNNFGAGEKLLATMLASRDQWLRHVVGNPEVERLRDELEDSLREVVEAALGELAAIFPARFKTETVELAQFAAGNLSRDGKSGDVLACAGLQGFPAASVDSLEQWRGLAGLFLTGQGTRRQRLTKNEGFPAGDRGRTAKERLNAIDLDDTVVERLHAVRSLPLPRFEAAQWDMLGALLVLLPVAVDQLRAVFQQEGRVDFTEIAIGARTSLGTDAEPTDLAFAIDCQIQHLLVDEFQDTSQSQYELLTRLVGEWQLGDGRTLFLVGDPMQSIYGFREADVGLFLRARTEGVGPVALTPLTLSVNFRSTAGVVDWVNRALGTAFPSIENQFIGAVTYEPSVPFRTESDADAVRVHAFLASDLDLEAERVLKIIGETRTQHPDGTIAVLVRSRSHLFGIVSALRRAGERFSAVEIDALVERPVVGDLVALTRALLHPADRIAWLSLLRAPWCGVVKADFVEALRGADGEEAQLPKDAEFAGIPLRRLSLDWTAPAPPEDIAWNAASRADSEEVGVHRPVFEWAGELQRRVGIVVHRMLQQMHVREGLAVREDTLRAALRSEGLDGEKLDEALSRASVALGNAAADEQGRWILSGHEDDRREYALSTVVERKVRRFVLDRTFVDDGVRWIIDYKTSTHEGGGRDAFLDNEQTRYREQMEGYARAMRSLDPRPIRLGLYFPLIQGWREWAFE